MHRAYNVAERQKVLEEISSLLKSLNRSNPILKLRYEVIAKAFPTSKPHIDTFEFNCIDREGFLRFLDVEQLKHNKKFSVQNKDEGEYPNSYVVVVLTE